MAGRVQNRMPDGAMSMNKGQTAEPTMNAKTYTSSTIQGALDEIKRDLGPDAVMLGDAWATDIEGALASGIRPVWLNRFGKTKPNDSVVELTSLEPVDKAVELLLRR